MSNLAYGFAHADTTAAMPNDATRTTQNAWANIIVILNPSVAFGLEYHYGMREANDGDFGDNHRLQFTLSYKPPPKSSGPSAAASWYGFPGARGEPEPGSGGFSAPWLDQL